MSEGKGSSKSKKDESKKNPKVPKDEPVADPNLELKKMFAQFLISSKDNQSRNRTDILELRGAILELKKSDYVSPTRDELPDTPLISRPRGGRRSSMFLGMSQPPSSPLGPKTDNKPNIQVLQADIVYDKELNVISLEGLQYLALLSSKYPGEIKIAHMVSYNLRPLVLASWNSYRYRESIINGAE
jgi:hypothetical protein